MADTPPHTMSLMERMEEIFGDDPKPSDKKAAAKKPSESVSSSDGHISAMANLDNGQDKSRKERGRVEMVLFGQILEVPVENPFACPNPARKPHKTDVEKKSVLSGAGNREKRSRVDKSKRSDSSNSSRNSRKDDWKNIVNLYYEREEMKKKLYKERATKREDERKRTSHRRSEKKVDGERSERSKSDKRAHVKKEENRKRGSDYSERRREKERQKKGDHRSTEKEQKKLGKRSSSFDSSSTNKRKKTT